MPTRHIDRWIGVVKAYTTRVGGGPFPTEQDNATGERIRRSVREFGTVTGRPRRCGWFDAVVVRHAARVSGSTELAVMLLDVLSGIPELNVAVAYDLDGQRITELPAALPDFERCRPIYETLPGWNEDHHGRPAMDRSAPAGQAVRRIPRQAGGRPREDRLGGPRSAADDPLALNDASTADVRDHSPKFDPTAGRIRLRPDLSRGSPYPDSWSCGRQAA